MSEPARNSAPRRNDAARTSVATDLSLIAVFAALIAALAIMPAMSLGGIAVPFTFQTLGIYITAQVLGGKRATAAVALYLLVGFCGFVVLTACGIAGMMMNAHMSFVAAFNAAMVFVPWDLVKSAIAVLVGLSVRRAFPSLAPAQH